MIAAMQFVSCCVCVTVSLSIQFFSLLVSQSMCRSFVGKPFATGISTYETWNNPTSNGSFGTTGQNPLDLQ